MLSPVFILGCGRSGTTLLGTILNAHPALDVPLSTSLYMMYGGYVPIPGVMNNINQQQWRKLLKLFD